MCDSVVRLKLGWTSWRCMVMELHDRDGRLPSLGGHLRIRSQVDVYKVRFSSPPFNEPSITFKLRITKPLNYLTKSEQIHTPEMSAIPAAGTFDQLNFTGGFPSSVDLAPSIIFFILYALSVPVFGWRVFSSSSRDLALIRPGIFVLCRLGTLGLRAVMSKNSYSVSELGEWSISPAFGLLWRSSMLEWKEWSEMKEEY